jgi:hypothetical protein
MTEIARADALSTLAEGAHAVRRQLEGIADVELTRPSAIGGGEWSAKDLIGHLTFWEELALQVIDAWRAGEMPWIESPPDDIDKVNEDAVAAKAPLPLGRIRVEAANVYEGLVREISGMADEEWTSDPPYASERPMKLFERLGAVLGTEGRPFGHAFAHLNDLEAFARTARSDP